MVKLENLDSVKNSLKTLSPRERNLITITAIIAIIIFSYYLLSSVISYQKSTAQNATSKKMLLEQISMSVQKHKSLRTKLDNLTTKYLNSSLSYEELTNHLDKSAKSIINSDNYELIPSKEKIELGTDFIARKFSIKIKKCTYQEALRLLATLEVGPPPVLLQKLDISKSYDNKSISAIFEIISVQKKKA